MKLDIFPDQRDGDGSCPSVDAGKHFVPFAQIDLRRTNAKLAADNGGEMALLQHDRRLIEHRQRAILNHAVGLDVAEQRNFLKNRRLQRLITAQNDDVWVDAHALKLLDRVLCGL